MDYFRSISSHIHGEMDIDVIVKPDKQINLITLGSDDIVTWRKLINLENGQIKNIQLKLDHGFNKIALHPSGEKFLLGGTSQQLFQFYLNNEQPELVYEARCQIRDIKYSPSGQYISVATDEQKVILIDKQNNRKTKCRPGHDGKVYNTFFSLEDKYVGSIGQDCTIVIYQIFSQKDPQQVFRTKFTTESISALIQASFLKTKQAYKVLVPGTTNLQIVEQLKNNWEIKKTMIRHEENILVAQAINSERFATSCQKKLCIWSAEKYENLIEFEMPFTKILPNLDSFIGIKNDGYIYLYNRQFNTVNNSNGMDLQEQNGEQSRIQFNNQIQDQDIQLQYEQEEQALIQQKQSEEKAKKKRIADKIIKVYPQLQLTRSTSFFDQARFLFMNIYGLIYELRQPEQTVIQVEFHHQDNKSKTLMRGRQLKYFDMNDTTICYANESHYGMKRIGYSNQFERSWVDIQGIALGGNWIAVANLSEIRFVDFQGYLIKSICFDRAIITMQAYENLLVVVYHESIPVYQSQVLSMRIFNVNQTKIIELPECHVPLSVFQHQQKASILRWFGFSMQGMIFSQDSLGMIRSYSLQSNQWTPIVVETLPESKKAWILGFSKYQIKYWKTTQSQPEPTVRPRLNIKSSRLLINSIIDSSQLTRQQQNIPYLLWKRYCLDHQMARWRMWGHLKSNRDKKHPNYQLSSSILNQKEISLQHNSIDKQFYPIIMHYLKQKKGKALNMVKSHIRSIQSGRLYIEIFDQKGHRNEAIDLEYYIQQREKQLQYEGLQDTGLKELKSKIEVNLKTKRENPMNPKFRKQIREPIPLSISSQQSQNSSIIMQDITHKSQEASRVEQPIQNPFLKKKVSSGNDIKQQINDHIEKFAVKKKVEDKKKK